MYRHCMTAQCGVLADQDFVLLDAPFALSTGNHKVRKNEIKKERLTCIIYTACVPCFGRALEALG